MAQIPTEEPFNTPQFVREREAWYKAGAGVMAGYTALGVLVVGTVAGAASLFFGIGPYQVAMCVVIGTWTCIVATEFYIKITARETTSRGGVEVDYF